MAQHYDPEDAERPVDWAGARQAYGVLIVTLLGFCMFAKPWAYL